MKKILTLLIAVLLAAVCPLSVSAMELPDDTGASFADMEVVECDMLSGYAPIICVDENQIYGITPREHYLRFALRDGIGKDTAVTQVLEVLEEVYPGITERYHAKDYDSPAARLLTNDQGYFEVEDYTDTAGSAEISEQIMQKLAEKGLSLVVRKGEGSFPVRADARHTQRIFDNLMSNVLKYALPGTRVYLELREEESGPAVIFRNTSRTEIIQSPAELTERFVRGDASRSSEGSGLGLSIARSLAELQGGSLTVTVDGDLFKVTLSFAR